MTEARSVSEVCLRIVLDKAWAEIKLWEAWVWLNNDKDLKKKVMELTMNEDAKYGVRDYVEGMDYDDAGGDHDRAVPDNGDENKEKEFDMGIDEHAFLDLWTLELGLKEINFMSGTRFDCDEESRAHAELDKLLDSLVVRS